ncbi:hypothetical protein J2Z35_000922 [Acetoanaerobium pronyense]|uniref:Outer membrane efflux protein n=1 Tax=Acetoanaerobium pronyense TaxID=1482736 RepID=A0ABS4KHA7_9FIRM|nr:hypothetical protein [Acetoanaerobium pronyense]
MKTKKILSFLLILSTFIFTAGTVDIFAEEENNLLTIEEAYNLAKKNNPELRKLDNQNRRANESSRSLEYDLGFYLPEDDPFGFKSASFMAQSKQIRFQKDQVEVQKMVTLENIKLQILSAFNNIDKAINEKEILILKISRMREKLNLEKIKNNLGVSSQFDLITMQNELSNSEKNLEKLNKSIESYYLELEKVLNTKVDRPIESNKVSFEKLNESETDVTKQESLALSNNILVWGKEQEIDFKEFELELFILTLPPINTGESISSEPYNIKKIDQSLLSNELSTLRNDVRESVRTKYDNIKTLEKNREILINSIRILEEEIKMMKVRESAGLITQEPIKDMNLQLVELKNTLEEIERQHGFLIYVYSNPVLSGM